MPYRKEHFNNGDIAHIVLRAIDNNLLFKDINDYYRGIFASYEFNNALPVVMRDRRVARKKLKEAIANGIIDPVSAATIEAARRDKFVEILAFAFMPNHIHLLVRQLKDGGITRFMHKFDLGVGSYLNARYKRKGPVFQSRFVAVPILSDEQLEVAFVYIHTNPIALIEPGWKEKGIANPERAIEFLENEYRWSSYGDYLGKKNFPSVTDREFIIKLLGGVDCCKECVDTWIKHKEELHKAIAGVDAAIAKAAKPAKTRSLRNRRDRVSASSGSANRPE